MLKLRNSAAVFDKKKGLGGKSVPVSVFLSAQDRIRFVSLQEPNISEFGAAAVYAFLQPGGGGLSPSKMGRVMEVHVDLPQNVVFQVAGKGEFILSSLDLYKTLSKINPQSIEAPKRLGETVTVRTDEEKPLTEEEKTYRTVNRVVRTASMAASVYHGYKRNDSIGWALWWGAAGWLFPIITPAIGVAQGFGKKAAK